MKSKLLQRICNRLVGFARLKYSRAANSDASIMNVDAAISNDASPPIKTKVSTKMAGWQFSTYGSVDVLEFSDNLQVPRLRNADDCLVRISSTTVNPIDAIMLEGQVSRPLMALRKSIDFPLTLGREFCGTLTHRGMNANTKIPLGQRVCGVVPLEANGSHAEYVVVPSHCITKAPEHLDDDEAAAVFYAALTAWSGLYLTGGLGGMSGALNSTGGGADKRVLVLGGSGGVGSMAIQILKSQKAQVVATCSDDAMEMVHLLGADYVVDYNSKDQFDTLRQHAPYDIILECAGRGPQYALKLDFKYNQYITFSPPLLHNIDDYGFGLGTIKNISDLFEKNVQCLGKQGALLRWGFFVPAKQGMDFIQKLVESKSIYPLIDSRFTFAQLPEAFKKVQAGHLRGKVVVKLD